MEKTMNKSDVMNMISCPLDDNLNFIAASAPQTEMNATDSSCPSMSCWDYWQYNYYPIIRESYPIYIRERAIDKGKQAFEVIKMLKDSRFLKLDTVSDFIDLMDKLIKIL